MLELKFKYMKNQGSKVQIYEKSGKQSFGKDKVTLFIVIFAKSWTNISLRKIVLKLSLQTVLLSMFYAAL